VRQLVLPLQQMAEQYVEPAAKLLVIATSQVLQLLGQMLDIDVLTATRLGQLSGLPSPGMDIVLVQVDRGHVCRRKL